jgi:hypothetical protein
MLPGESDRQFVLRDVADRIRLMGGKVTSRDVLNHMRRQFPTAADADGILNELVAAGHGKINTDAPAGPGRPASPVFELLEMPEAEPAVVTAEPAPAATPEAACPDPEPDAPASPSPLEVFEAMEQWAAGAEQWAADAVAELEPAESSATAQLDVIARLAARTDAVCRVCTTEDLPGVEWAESDLCSTCAHPTVLDFQAAVTPPPRVDKVAWWDERIETLDVPLDIKRKLEAHGVYCLGELDAIVSLERIGATVVGALKQEFGISAKFARLLQQACVRAMHPAVEQAQA